MASIGEAVRQLFYMILHSTYMGREIGRYLNYLHRCVIAFSGTKLFAVQRFIGSPILFLSLDELINYLVYKVHVSLPSPKALSVHVQDQCVVGNPI